MEQREERNSYGYQQQDQDQIFDGTERWSMTPQILDWNPPSGMETGYRAYSDAASMMDYGVRETNMVLQASIDRREEGGYDDSQTNRRTGHNHYPYPRGHGLEDPTRMMYLLPGQQEQQRSHVRGSYHASSLDRSPGLGVFPQSVYHQTTPQPERTVPTSLPTVPPTLPVMGGRFILGSNVPADSGNYFFDSVRPKAELGSPGAATQLGRTSLQEQNKNINVSANAVNVRSIRIQDRDQILKYYTDAFHALQQTNCRLIAKAFIKVVEPKKQARFPYNGGKKGPDGTKGDPELTKPGWWPTGVTHREPDHLKKPERVHLLIYILRGLSPEHKSRNITVNLLQEATRSVRRRVKPAERMEILNEIFRVRRVEERYESGEIEGSTEVLVTDRLWKISPSPSPSQNQSQIHPHSHTDEESQSQSQSPPESNQTRSAEGIRTRMAFSSSPLSTSTSTVVLRRQQQQQQHQRPQQSQQRNLAPSSSDSFPPHQRTSRGDHHRSSHSHSYSHSQRQSQSQSQSHTYSYSYNYNNNNNNPHQR